MHRPVLASGEFTLPHSQRFIATAAAALMMLSAFQAPATSLAEANDLTRRLVPKTMAKEHIPGMHIAVVNDDRIVLSCLAPLT